MQRTTDPAYEKCPNFVYDVKADGLVASYNAYDHVIPSSIKIVKFNGESGLEIAYPATWQIYSKQTNSFVKMTVNGKKTDVFVSDAQGKLTLPEQLPYGDYLLHELKAPASPLTGYVLNPVDVPFSVTERRDIDNPLVVTMNDTPAKGRIEITKRGTVYPDKPVEGAEYTVYAKEDIYTLDGIRHLAAGDVAAVLVTDASGKAVSPLLYLGKYTVKETKSPKGYILDTTEYDAAVLYADQTTPVVYKCFELRDKEVIINLEKRSALPSATLLNPIYFLEGAVYDVYTMNWDKVGSIVTDKEGKGSLGGIDAGTYRVKESVPSKGYDLDPQIYLVTTDEKTPVQTVSSPEPPYTNPFRVILQKVDADYGKGGIDQTGQARGSLAGAEYTIKYYAGLYYSLDETNKATPSRTWIIQTQANGYATLNDWVRGDELFHDSKGDIIIPLGTITVVETKAPKGYVLPRPGDANYKVFLTRYLPDPASLNGVRMAGDGNGVLQGNAPIHKDQIQRGDIEITKFMKLYESDSVIESGQRAPEANVRFDFYVSRDFTGTTPNTGASPAFSLTTDKDGFASTIASDIYLIQLPDGTNQVITRPVGSKGGLPYDTYLCVQATTDPAYEKCNPFVFTIGNEGQVIRRVLEDSIIAAYLKIVKLDAESGREIALPASWQIYSEQTNAYVEMTVDGERTALFTSNDQGELTLPEQLPFGQYRLQEVQAPTGYLINPIDVPFVVAERHDAADPLVVTFEDAPVKGIIEIHKEGAKTATPVEGAEYTVYADGDIVSPEGTVRAVDGEKVAVLSTGINGKAASDPLYLGTYTVKETAAPDGYLSDEKEYKVELAYKNQLVTIVYERLNLIDDEITFKVEKLDKSTGRPIPDTEFTLYRESAQGVGDWIEVDKLVTDKDGKLSFYPVVQGSYKSEETRPNPNYASSEESGEEGSRYFTIDENSTGEVQVFYDEMIQISCETYKDTINITSAGFRTFEDDYLQIENVGAEQYHYTFDFRSTSNVRADEFTVVDPLTEVFTGHVRVRELFTPVTQGDTDGFFNLWYQTNHTDTSQLYSSANAMDTNPHNPNNPENTQKWSSVGWQLWQQNIPATSMVRLSVADLGLASDEYITALRYEYGSVEVGFTTRATGKQALQQSKELKGTFSDWSDAPQAADGSTFQALSVNLEPATYLVDCSTVLLPPALILGSASVSIARNVVLSDDDRDTVKTTVIEPFMMQTVHTPPTDITRFEDYIEPTTGELPVTGDNGSLLAYLLAIALLLLATALQCARFIQSRKGLES